MQILLTPDQESTIKNFFKHVKNEKGENWYYCPLYFKDTLDSTYECLRFDQIPEEVKDLVLKNQGIKLPTE
jgi:hypothetical protein